MKAQANTQMLFAGVANNAVNVTNLFEQGAFVFELSQEGKAEKLFIELAGSKRGHHMLAYHVALGDAGDVSQDFSLSFPEHLLPGIIAAVINDVFPAD